MALTSADLTRIAIVELTGVPPVVPLAPQFNTMRVTGESVAFNSDSTTSQELDPSGQVRDSVTTGAETSGDLNFEFAQDSALELAMEAVFGNAFILDPGGAPGPNRILIPGTDLRYFLLEKTFNNDNGSYFHRFDKTSFSSLALNLAPGALPTGTVSTIGGVMSLDQAIIGGATYLPISTTPVFRPHNIMIYVNGSAGYCTSAFSITMSNSMRGVKCIGVLGNADLIRGRFTTEMSGTFYFEDNTLNNLHLNETAIKVDIVFLDLNGNPVYTFGCPKCRINSSPTTASGTDSEVTTELSIQALYDDALGYTTMITQHN